MFRLRNDRNSALRSAVQSTLGRRPAMYIGASLGGILILLLILWVLGVIH